MAQNLESTEISRVQTFEAPRAWQSNVWAAAVAGICGSFVILIVAGILAFDSAGPSGQRAGVALALLAAGALAAAFPGNVIAGLPYKVELQPGTGLWLYAPLRKLFIPMAEVKEIRQSALSQLLQEGIIVKLNRRHGLLKSFTIHWAFGQEGKRLAEAINDQILANPLGK